VKPPHDAETRKWRTDLLNPRFRCTDTSIPCSTHLHFPVSTIAFLLGVTLRRDEYLHCITSDSKTIDEWIKKVWEWRCFVLVQLLTQHFPGGTEKTTKYVIQDSCWPDRYSNRHLPYTSLWWYQYPNIEYCKLLSRNRNLQWWNHLLCPFGLTMGDLKLGGSKGAPSNCRNQESWKTNTACPMCDTSRLEKLNQQLTRVAVILTIYRSYDEMLKSWDSAGVGVRVSVGSRIFPSPCPDQLWGPPSFLSNGYRGLFPRGVKRPGCEADHSPPTSAEVKKTWVCTFTPTYVFME
jgi:hypothetical protein